jgi:DNA-binding response OmpR family regulator
MKKTILAIDNSKAIRFVLQTVLGKHFQVISAPDAFTAMYWLNKKVLPDLIIADPQLPDVEDWELIEQLSASEIYNTVPLLVLSSLPKEVVESKSIHYGVAGSFTKPFNPIEILESARLISSAPKINGILYNTVTVNN